MVAVKSYQADAFLKAVERAPSSVLFYGTDAGLVAERAATLAKRLAQAHDGEILRLDDTDLEDSPDRIGVELLTRPMFGGRKIVRAATGRRINAASLKPVVEVGRLEGFLIVEAGSLRKGDALLTLFETAAGAAAVACYPDEARDLDGMVGDVLAAARMQIAPEARRLLVSRLGADRALSRAELEKLVLYARGKARIEEADVEAAVGDAAETALDRVVMAAALSIMLTTVAAYLVRTAPIAIVWSSLFVMLGGMSELLANSTGDRTWNLLNPWRNIRYVGRLWFASFRDSADAWQGWWALGIMSVVCGLMLVMLFTYRLRLLPAFGAAGLDAEFLAPAERLLDALRHLALPAATLTLVGLGGIARFVRGALADVRGSLFLTVARAKGLKGRTVLLRHALRNALIPVLTLLGLSLPALFSGAVFVEAIFAWPGVGRVLVDAVAARDYPVVLAATAVSAALVVAGGLLADALSAVADPRLRHAR